VVPTWSSLQENYKNVQTFDIFHKGVFECPLTHRTCTTIHHHYRGVSPRFADWKTQKTLQKRHVGTPNQLQNIP
jgi:hypothetical protein